MAQGRGKRIRKVQKVPPPQQEATTTLSDNVPTTTSMYENVPGTTTVCENVLTRTVVHVNARARTNVPPQTNMPPPPNMSPSIQLPTQQGMPFVCTGVKRKRGKSCGKALQEHININGGPLRINFHPTMLVPADLIISKMFTSEIGIIVRSGAPVFFVVDLTNPVVVEYVDAKMSTAYSQFKTRLKKEWKTFGSPELGRGSMPNADLWNERPVSHWHWLCDNIYTNQSCIEIAEKNSVNRNMQQHTHRAGARPYIQHALVAFKEKMEAERNVLFEKLIQAAPMDTPHDSIKLTVEAEFPIMAKELGRKGRMIYGVGNVPHIHSHIHRVSTCASNSTEVVELRALIDQLSSNMLIMKEQNGHLMAQVESLLRQPPGQLREGDFPASRTSF
ncbi:hypothetical protein M0R45_001380 [Rubus argutus]|uniref:Transposase n=1 Tax=Rubus argutus TaxID=59490 RepID=A0AAW1VLR8_RUBAR